MTMEARGSSTRPSTGKIGRRDGSNRLSPLDIFCSECRTVLLTQHNINGYSGEKRLKLKMVVYINPYFTDLRWQGKWRYRVSEENIIRLVIEVLDK